MFVNPVRTQFHRDPERSIRWACLNADQRPLYPQSVERIGVLRLAQKAQNLAVVLRFRNLEPRTVVVRVGSRAESTAHGWYDRIVQRIGCSRHRTQTREAAIGCHILNRMAELGRPKSYAVVL